MITEGEKYTLNPPSTVITYTFIGFFLSPNRSRVIAVRKIHNPTMPPARFETVQTLSIALYSDITTGPYWQSMAGSELEDRLPGYARITRAEALYCDPRLVTLVDHGSWPHGKRLD